MVIHAVMVFQRPMSLCLHVFESVSVIVVVCCSSQEVYRGDKNIKTKAFCSLATEPCMCMESSSGRGNKKKIC